MFRSHIIVFIFHDDIAQDFVEDFDVVADFDTVIFMRLRRVITAGTSREVRSDGGGIGSVDFVISERAGFSIENR